MSNHPQTKVEAIASKDNSSFLEEGELIEWLSNNGKYLAYALIGLLVLFVIFYRYSSSHTSQAEQDYVQASNDFAIFTKATDATDKTTVDEALKRLISLMKSHPELHAAYDGILAQTLLNQGRVEEAQAYAEATLKRTQIDELPYYTDFGANTLLIEAKQYQASLEKAQALQEKMSAAISQSPITSQRSFGEELFAINLFRIAMLQQQLNDKAGELATWQLWKQYAGLDSAKTAPPLKVNPQAFRAVIQQLAIGSMALPDYITYRENELKK